MTTPPKPEEAIVDAALELPAHERAAYLDKVCGNDPQLRQLVEALLHAHKKIISSQINPPRDLSTPSTDSAPSEQGDQEARSLDVKTMVLPVTPIEKPGDQIGRYKLLQQIGEGGGGIVYMAEQVEPVRRRVALKIIKLGMDTKQVVARFEAERQALALMDHPNIARVHDAGATETGRPFFVMELVRGRKITEFCDERRMPPRERLELFVQVCAAVQHAHQKGIIHRDLKPSNILVTIVDGKPVPKVIDFGIAKATSNQWLTDKTLFTAFEQFMGTPAYTSPEQAELSGVDIDTRSDIYSLGVLLYELLTGQMPFDPRELAASGFEEMRRIIRTKDPLRPSTRLSDLSAADQTTVAKCRQVEAPKLIHLVRGDLDWIVMKCLEKERNRRYETANGLAMDIQRHLNNEAVVARPPSRLYEFQKSVRRHKLGFAAGAAVVTALAVGLALAAWALAKERRERERAVAAESEQSRLRRQAQTGEQRAETEAAKSRQVAQFLEEMLQGAGPSVARGRDVTVLREIVDKAAERVSKELKSQPLVEAELKAVLGEVYLAVGREGKAEAMEREALDLRRKVLGNECLEVAASLCSLGNVLKHEQRQTEAEALLREALAIRRKLLGPEHALVAATLDDLGRAVRDQKRYSEAETFHRQALAMRRKLLGNDDPSVAVSLNNLGKVLNAQSRYPEAESLIREAMAMQIALFGEEHPEVAQCYGDLVDSLVGQGRWAEAEVASRKDVAMCRRIFGNESRPVVDALEARLAEALLGVGKPEEAEAACREALAIEKNLPDNKQNTLHTSLRRLGRALMDQGKWAQAEDAFRAELESEKGLGRSDWSREALAWLAYALKQEGKLAEAEAQCRENLATEEKVSGPETPGASDVLAALTAVLLEEGKFAEAESPARECSTLREEQIPDEWRAFNARAMLGGALLGQKKYAEAEPLLLAGYNGMEQREAKIPAAGKPHLKEALQRLVQLYEATGRPEQAAEWKQKLQEFEHAEARKQAASARQ